MAPKGRPYDAKEPTSERSPDELERDVLYELTAGSEPIWSVRTGALYRGPDRRGGCCRGLLAVGLIHKTTDGFVFATHAGYRAVAMIGATV